MQLPKCSIRDKIREDKNLQKILYSR